MGSCANWRKKAINWPVTFNSYQQKSQQSIKGAHSLMIEGQITTKTSNATHVYNHDLFYPLVKIWFVIKWRLNQSLTFVRNKTRKQSL